MVQPSNREKILRLFFDFPNKPFQIRQASRLSQIAFPSARNYLLLLEKEGLLKKVSGPIFSYFIANRESCLFKRLKTNDLLLRIEESGLIRKQLKREHPDCIVLFGSAARGEDTEKSDLDIFVQMKRKKFVLNDFEEVLKRNINLLFEPDLSKLSPELKNSLANGIVLDGNFAPF